MGGHPVEAGGSLGQEKSAASLMMSSSFFIKPFMRALSREVMPAQLHMVKYISSTAPLVRTLASRLA
jgi:hypothetical protein